MVACDYRSAGARRPYTLAGVVKLIALCSFAFGMHQKMPPTSLTQKEAGDNTGYNQLACLTASASAMPTSSPQGEV